MTRLFSFQNYMLINVIRYKQSCTWRSVENIFQPIRVLQHGRDCCRNDAFIHLSTVWATTRNQKVWSFQLPFFFDVHGNAVGSHIHCGCTWNEICSFPGSIFLAVFTASSLLPWVIDARLVNHFLISTGSYFVAGYVPKLHSTEYSILGISLSEKSWTYLLAGQLCLCKGTRSLGPSVIGILVGYLYMVDKNRLQKFRLPTPVEVTFNTAIQKLKWLSNLLFPYPEFLRICGRIRREFDTHGTRAPPRWWARSGRRGCG